MENVPRLLDNVDLSIVIPCFNEEQNIPFLISEIQREMIVLDLNYEILLVDDGSRDSTSEVIKRMAIFDDRISYIFLKQNYGHQTALTTGIKFSRGSCVIVMDADFQHPPKYLVDLYKIWQSQSVDVVQTKRKSFSQAENFLKKNFSYFFYKGMNFFFSTNLVEGGADFRLIGRKVLNEIKKTPRNSIFHRGFCASKTFSQAVLEIDINERRFGVTKYTFLKQLKLALLGLLEGTNFEKRFSLDYRCVDIKEVHSATRYTKIKKAS